MREWQATPPVLVAMPAHAQRGGCEPQTWMYFPPGCDAELMMRGRSGAARNRSIDRKVIMDGGKVVRLVRSEGTPRTLDLVDGSVIERSGGSVSWRNNNPGNLKF